jgi:hypothetical protein
MLEIHPSARKHAIGDEDIEHAVDHATSIDFREDDTRLYLGAGRNGELLEVVTIGRIGRPELAIHAMKIRHKYRRLLPRA